MGELKRAHGITSASWRAAIASLYGERNAKRDGARLDRERHYLTTEQAAETLGIHVQTMRAYVRSGRVPAYRLAGERAIRIRWPDLEKVLEPMVPDNGEAGKTKGD